MFADQARHAQVIQETEKLQTALLNAISHDLKTPLVSVIGVLSSLQEKSMKLDDSAKENLIQVAREEADKLNHLISNLLDESRIEAGAIRITRQPVEVQDIIGAALEQLGTRSTRHRLKIDIPSELPFIFVDVGLVVQALVNVIDNALKYSPPGTLIEIQAQSLNGEMQIEIIDQGIGIPPQDIDRVFDKFYRIQRPDNVSGTGMGLSISKGIIESHGGRIEASNRSGGGTIIKILISNDQTRSTEREPAK
jgi:two-component system sensor histidine kinase KdpD